MSRNSKSRRSGAPTESGFWKRIGAATQQRERAHEAREAALLESVRPPNETKQALKLAAQGTSEHPVGSPYDDRIRIDFEVWAPLILDAVIKFVVCPGVSALRTKRINERGLGIRAGLHIFHVALKTMSVEQVLEELLLAREHLGSAVLNRSGRDDSEIGIAAFFRALDSAFDGRHWLPPRRICPRRVRTVTSPAEQPPAPGSPPMRALLAQLDARGASPEQRDQILRAAQALDGIESDFIARTKLRDLLGVPPQTVDHFFVRVGTPADRRGGISSRDPKLYSRALLFRFLAQWAPDPRTVPHSPHSPHE